MVKDMYGHTIVPIAEGYGVSVAVNSKGEPLFTIFADDDDYHQALFLVNVHDDRPHVANVFKDRMRKALAGA